VKNRRRSPTCAVVDLPRLVQEQPQHRLLLLPGGWGAVTLHTPFATNTSRSTIRFSTQTGHFIVRRITSDTAPTSSSSARP
jgi:hypothetical protein